MSCDSFDLDSISQLSLADSASNSVADLYKSASRAEAGGLQPLPSLKSVSTDNIPNLELSYHGPRYARPSQYRHKLLPSLYLYHLFTSLSDCCLLGPGSRTVLSGPS